MQTIINHPDGSSTPVWVTYVNESECKEWNEAENLIYNGDDIYTPGYYWAVCSPGCIPDSEFFGPFSTEMEAESAAEEQLNY